MLTNDNEESRRSVEFCYKRHKVTVNPIIDWSDSEVWEFIKSEKIPYCELYDNGFGRIGCIGCPLAGTKTQLYEFSRYPKYKQAYLLAFKKMLENREKKNLASNRKWENATPMDVFHWWLDDGVLKGQINLFEEET